MRPFELIDYKTIHAWCDKRDIPAPDPVYLPPTGLITDNLACGFLIVCDNKFGILDFFLTNPDMPRGLRISALDEIAHLLTDTAKRLGVKVLKCDTQVDSIKDLAFKHDFHDQGQFTALVKGL